MRKSLETNLSQITKEEFLKYKVVKDCGVIPLYEFANVMQATKLKSNTLMLIMDNYTALLEKYYNGEME